MKSLKEPEYSMEFFLPYQKGPLTIQTVDNKSQMAKMAKGLWPNMTVEEHFALSNEAFAKRNQVEEELREFYKKTYGKSYNTMTVQIPKEAEEKLIALRKESQDLMAMTSIHFRIAEQLPYAKEPYEPGKKYAHYGDDRKPTARMEAASAMVGKRVVAWTAMNGIYTGILQQIFGKPWRGKVLITGVVEPAAYEISRGDRQRRGMRPGQEIEVGGVNITESPLPPGKSEQSYLEALQMELAINKGYVENPSTSSSRDIWAIKAIIKNLETQIEREKAATSTSTTQTPRRRNPKGKGWKSRRMG